MVDLNRVFKSALDSLHPEGEPETSKLASFRDDRGSSASNQAMEVSDTKDLHTFAKYMGNQGTDICRGSATLQFKHHWCVRCGNCDQPGCKIYAPHLPTPILGVGTEAPAPDRGGHPRFYKILEEIAEIHSKKNTDYAKGGQQGPLGNFHRTAKFLQMYPKFDWCKPAGVAIGYMLKQLDAALILYSSGRQSVTGEGISERLKDVAVYALIAMILVEDELQIKQETSDEAIYR